MEVIDKLNQIESDVKEIKTALLGDDYGNKGFKQRLEKVEQHVEESKKRVWIERGIMISLAFGWGIVLKIWDKIF
jgi:hypothetical protein